MAIINRTKKFFALMVAILICILSVNPVSVYATWSGERDMVLEKDVSLDSSHSIHIYVKAHIKYSYDEGVYGWIDSVTISDDSGVASNEVRIETLQPVAGDNTDSSRYWIKYLFCGEDFLNYYMGYITVYFDCDEWGDLSGGISYEEA